MSLVTWSQPHVLQSCPSTCAFHHIPGIIITMPLTSSGFGGQLFYSAAALQSCRAGMGRASLDHFVFSFLLLGSY